MWHSTLNINGSSVTSVIALYRMQWFAYSCPLFAFLRRFSRSGKGLRKQSGIQGMKGHRVVQNLYLVLCLSPCCVGAKRWGLLLGGIAEAWLKTKMHNAYPVWSVCKTCI